MILMYGCKAPWLLTINNRTCETDLNIKNIESPTMDKINDLMSNLQLNDMFDVMPDCPKPCVTMDIKVKPLLTGTGTTSSLWVHKSKRVCYSLSSLPVISSFQSKGHAQCFSIFLWIWPLLRHH